jgi:hypothetical protein
MFYFAWNGVGYIYHLKMELQKSSYSDVSGIQMFGIQMFNV